MTGWPSGWPPGRGQYLDVLVTVVVGVAALVLTFSLATLAGTFRYPVVDVPHPEGPVVLVDLDPVEVEDGRTVVPDGLLATGRPVVEVADGRGLGRLGRELGWDEVTVVTPRQQVARIRLEVEGCTGAEVRVVAASRPGTPIEVPWTDALREALASIRIAFRPDC